MRRLVALALFALVASLAGLELSRLRLEADLFELLPAGAPMVEALRLYQTGFGSSRELVLTIDAADAEEAEQVAGEVAAALEREGLAQEVVWRHPVRENPAAAGEMVAWLWANGSSEELERLASRLAPERIDATLEETLDRLTTSLSAEEIARLSNDPFGLTEVTRGVGSLGELGEEDPFVSEDGGFRVLFAAAPFPGSGLEEYRDWVESTRALLADPAGPVPEEVEVRITGNPAFVADTGSGLLRDTRRAAVGTLFVVGLLFAWAHRRWLPLVWLLTLLLVVLALTVGIGSLALGALHVASLGFAAILLGLAADYGLILYQELRSDPTAPVATHRRAVAPGILWAAVTTAGAFFMITRSSLPGLAQLGALVTIGILLAAVLLLVAFLPPVARGESGRPEAGRSALLPRLVARRAWAWGTTALLALGATAVLLVRLPAVDPSTDELGPRDSEPRSALAAMEERLGVRDHGLWLVVEGESRGGVAERLDVAGERLDRAVSDGLLRSFLLPTALWPRPESQQPNLEILARLVDRHPAARAAALEAGFTEEALALTDHTFAAWSRFAAQPVPLEPTTKGFAWLLRQFSSVHEGRVLALGRLEAAADAGTAELRALASELGEGGGHLFGWSLLSESLLELLRRDVARVLLPMTVVLLVLLSLAFRAVVEVALSLLGVAFSLLGLCALMALLGWSWNLMSIMALPLLFGAGVDYAIHVQLALRRHAGDAGKVADTVGRAILLCGASTVTGFGTLGLASNAGLASLGRVAAVGVALTALTCTLLLPTWWRALRRSSLRSAEEEP